MERYYIAANWKMNLSRAEAACLAKAFVQELKDGKNKYMIAPSFTLLDTVGNILKGSNILLGAQNMCFEEKGAYTGEVSVLQLLEAGVQTVILGHSERRHIFGESDEVINKKVKLALSHGLEVILCVGELLTEREENNAEKVCGRQLTLGLKDVSETDFNKITVAYEPVWAIGTGKTASPADAEAMHKHIRQTAANIYSAEAAEKLVIQYGGSMKAENAKELLSEKNINGGLIGGAGLKIETFKPIALFSQ